MKKKKLNKLKEEWESFYQAKEISHELMECYMSYALNLMEKDLPPIFDFHHLTLLMKVNSNFLSSVISCPQKFYRDFTIPKRSSGTRTITAPYPSLKYIQRWILSNILDKVKIHGCAHGFVRKRSILTNVKIHQGNKYLLKIDLKDFFPSIKIDWVIQIFKELGYEHTVAFYMASICCCEDQLPQGAPTSPAISNIAVRHLDRRLYRLAKKFTLNYSRYADDIAFSGNKINGCFVRYACDIIKDCGLTVNENKIRLYNNRGSKILTGISLASGVPKITRSYRRELVQELYYIKKFGLNGHTSHNKIRKSNYIESLIGKH